MGLFEAFQDNCNEEFEEYEVDEQEVAVEKGVGDLLFPASNCLVVVAHIVLVGRVLDALVVYRVLPCN